MKTKPIALDMPEDEAELAGWLERLVVGERLELARRITEFRQGCSVLILSDHKPLTADDRAWLVERCRAWVAKLDAHLAFLESGQPAATIRDQADATIHALIAALRERAKPMS
jgi:hypothetical protein